MQSLSKMVTPVQPQFPLKYESDSDPNDDELEDDVDVERWMVTESALNRWSRFPAEAQRYAYQIAEPYVSY